ncbi:ParB/RepB/Spo0J family partition protein [Candidatus Nomurabacteria bacterium]|nr:ParB/RepB/Spo0J family partition protein [Candidatus Nomurabacteria bacterium]
MVKKGLGRGFSSLIPDDLLDESFDPTAGQDEKVSDLRNIQLSKITTDPDQPRRHFDEAALDELANSVKQHGVVQPIVVVPHNGGYQIVAGERRFRAAGLAKLKTIPAIVRTLTAQHKLELALIENLQRRDLNAMETATAYAKLRDQFNLSLEEIGSSVGGKSVSAVSNTLRLLKLPMEVKKALAEGRMTEGQARPLVGVEESVAHKLLPQIIEGNWSARRVEQMIYAYRKPNRKQTANSLTKSQEQRLDQLVKRVSAPITVKPKSRGGGTITISYKTDEEFERITDALL